MEDWTHAALKEWYWIVIVGAIVSLAFAPSFLKAKCPKCKKKALRTVDTDAHLLSHLSEEDRKPFLTFYRCDKCSSRFVRERTAPLADASDARWTSIFEHSHEHIPL